jgi:hypothetical protein
MMLFELIVLNRFIFRLLVVLPVIVIGCKIWTCSRCSKMYMVVGEDIMESNSDELLLISLYCGGRHDFWEG